MRENRYKEAQRLWNRAVETNGTLESEYWWSLYCEHLGKYFARHKCGKKRRSVIDGEAGRKNES